MQQAIRKESKVRAWRLGEMTEMEKNMIKAGKIVRRDNDKYEIFSQETSGSTGQMARIGDYFKVDSTGCPYPNEKTVFERRHKRIDEEWYERKSEPVYIWRAGDEITPEIQYLLSTGVLDIHSESKDSYFTAHLWGTCECANKNAVLVIYSINKRSNGEIENVDFNFVEENEFAINYELI